MNKRHVVMFSLIIAIVIFATACKTSDSGTGSSHKSEPLKETSQNVVATNNAFNSKSIAELNVGDRVVDLSWEWQFRTDGDYTYQQGDETKPVIWIIVAKDHYGPDSGITLLAEELIGYYAFDNSTDRGDEKDGSSHWGDSGSTNASRGLRPWLNSTGKHKDEGFCREFSNSFKSALIVSPIPNRDRVTGDFYVTHDIVFVPSIIEFGDTRFDQALEVGTVYPYFKDVEDAVRVAFLGGEEEAYWTRTSELTFSCFLYGIVRGRCGPGRFAADAWYTGVRPAVTIKNDTPISKNPNAEGIYIIGK
jgi:hypothetical protein